MKKLKTIDLKGKQYVQVSERVLAFNETYTDGMITAEPTFKDNTVYFKAMVIPDVKNKERFFVGHSFGELGKEKALEKLETVAVGRALAFMGIGIVEGIASADEMSNFQNKSFNPETEKQPVCDICGTLGIKAKTKTGTIFWTCPEWKNHQADGQKFKMVFADNMDDQEKEFANQLDNIK